MPLEALLCLYYRPRLLPYKILLDVLQRKIATELILKAVLTRSNLFVILDRVDLLPKPGVGVGVEQRSLQSDPRLILIESQWLVPMIKNVVFYVLRCLRLQICVLSSKRELLIRLISDD